MFGHEPNKNNKLNLKQENYITVPASDAYIGQEAEKV